MECFNTVFPVILYVLLFILLVVLIVFVLKMMGTLNKVDRVIDDINNKSSKLNGLFDIVDHTTDMVASVSDLAVGFITNSLTNLLSNKKKEDDANE